MKQITVTSKELGEIFNLTDRRIRQFVDDEGAPKLARNNYDLVEFTRWMIEYERKLILAQFDTGSLEDEKTRLTKAQADMKEIELAEKKQQLLKKAEVEDTWIKIITYFKTKILTIPGKMAPILIGAKDTAEIKDLLEAQVYETLAELGNNLIDKIENKPEKVSKKTVKKNKGVRKDGKGSKKIRCTKK